MNIFVTVLLTAVIIVMGLFIIINVLVYASSEWLDSVRGCVHIYQTTNHNETLYYDCMNKIPVEPSTE